MNVSFVFDGKQLKNEHNLKIKLLKRVKLGLKKLCRLAQNYMSLHCFILKKYISYSKSFLYCFMNPSITDRGAGRQGCQKKGNGL